MSLSAPGFDWTTLAIVVGVLVVGWVILRLVLRLTVRVFAMGCTALLLLGAALAVLMYFRR